MSDAVEIADGLIEIINDELAMYFDMQEGDKQLAHFIAEGVMATYHITPIMNTPESVLHVPVTTQELEDLFMYCNENNLSLSEFIRTTLADAIV